VSKYSYFFIRLPLSFSHSRSQRFNTN
jgi:hypothetical protein